MSKLRTSSSLLFCLAFVLVLVGVAAVRLTSWRTIRSVVQGGAATSSIPAMTSASFPEGDALAGLGADWTFLGQADSSMNRVESVQGVSSTRESVIQVVGQQTELILDEGTITDQAALTASLRSSDIKPLTIAGRRGYLVPVISMAGGTGFLLAGSSTTLLLEDMHSADWPSGLSSEVLSYIASVRVE